MVGIKINDKHSFNDYGLILTSKTITPPEVKSQVVDVAGGNGVIDLTDFFGEPKFKNREMTFEFTKIYTTLSAFMDDLSIISNNLNGQKVSITLDEDVDFYYVGRISLEYTKEKNVVKYTMTVDAEPYKLKHQNTVVTKQGSGTVTLNNLRKKVCPSITTTAETQLTFGTSVFNLSAGSWTLPELELKAGTNTVTVSGTGTTTFTYQEGGL